MIVKALRREYKEEYPKTPFSGLTSVAYARILIEKSVKLLPDSKELSY